MSRVTLSLFGSPSLADDGLPIQLPSRKALALLAYLAIRGIRQPRTALAALFWPDSDRDSAYNALRYTLSTLRKALHGRWLVTDRETVALDGTYQKAVDVLRFRSLLAQCRGHGHGPQKACQRCLPLLAEAVQIYHSDFLAGFTLPDSLEFDTWQSLETKALRQELVSALARLVQGYAAQGDVEQASAQAKRWLALDPLDEAAHRALMWVYAGSGQHTAALRQYEACVEVLREELGVSPGPETERLCQAIRERRVPALGESAPAVWEAPSVAPAGAGDVQASRPRHNLPVQVTPFIGREELVAQVRERLEGPGCRLLTVLGPGGMGKSRLALRAAEGLVEHFADGVCFVPLDALGSAELLAPTLLETLHVPRSPTLTPEGQLLRHLADQHLLLVLDGFEKLLEGATLVAQVLREAPGVKVLVTSRERLNLQEEWLLPLQGLSYPGEEAVTEALEGYEAVRLFVQRARQVRPDLTLTTEGASAVARICRWVEGMPLAIELAAPWVRALSPVEIVREIEGGLDFLSTTARDVAPRHRGMRAVFDHSWVLLSAEEQRVLRELSVFRGGFRRPAAEAVAGASLGVLAALVDRSWLRVTPAGHYEIHELVRQYCAEKLEEEEEARGRHSGYYGAFLQEREPHLNRRGEAEVFSEILGEMDNVWAAWAWAVAQGDVEMIGQCVETLRYADWVRGWHHEVLRAFEAGADRLRGLLEPGGRAWSPPEREQAILVLADILCGQGNHCMLLARREQAVVVLEECLSRLGDVGDKARAEGLRGYAKTLLGWLFLLAGERVQAEQLLLEGLAHAEQDGSPSGREYALYALGCAAECWGQYGRAEGLLQQAIAIARDTGDQGYQPHCLNILSRVLWNRGQYEQAKAVAQESLERFEEHNDPGGTSGILVRLGEVETAAGNYALAEEHFRRSLAICEAIDEPGIRVEAVRWLAELALLRGQHDEARKLFEENVAGTTRPGRPSSLVGLGRATAAVGELEQAREWFRQGLEGSMKAGPPYTVEALAGIAEFFGREGERERAVELLVLVLQHPVTFRFTKERAQRLLSQLESELPPHVLAAARARGEAQTLEGMAAEVLKELGRAA